MLERGVGRREVPLKGPLRGPFRGTLRVLFQALLRDPFGKQWCRHVGESSPQPSGRECRRTSGWVKNRAGGAWEFRVRLGPRVVMDPSARSEGTDA